MSQTQANEDARRILYGAASRIDFDKHSALVCDQAQETLMEAIFYLNHGRFSRARTGHGACAFAFAVQPAEETKTEMDKAVDRIAAGTLGISTLDTRNSDSMDFYDLAVWTLRGALEAAYRAGAISKGA